MPVVTLGAEHESPIHRRPLRLLDGDGIAVIDGGIAGGIDLHLPPLPRTLSTVDPDQNAPRLNLCDRGQHPVAHTKIAIVLAEEQTVAGGKTAQPFGRAIFETGEKTAARDAGRPDGRGQSLIEHHPDEGLAITALLKRAAAKRKRGYAI